ncbi:MAG: hypothetical protein WCF65_04345 [Parachlamydiaceae bacterium]
MRHVKSERLKKFEVELNDLEQWLKMGLVPKKDIEKHKEEIEAVKAKIEEEKERLQFLKESGEAEEYVTPKRQSARTGYTEMPTIPDIDIAETATGFGDTAFDMDTEAGEGETSVIEGRDDTDEEKTSTDEDEDEAEDKEEEDSYFSDKSRWRRGGIIDPEANDW